MRQRDAANTGRAEFHVPSNRKNNTFFDAIRWQKPSPGSPNEGRFSSGTMVFFDGAGPSGADIVVGGYHWPKGVQGMDRHTGKWFWAGNPDGGEAIGENTPAFSTNGSTLYVVNDSTIPDHPLMAFSAVSGPANYRHNGGDTEPWKLGRSSPKVGPDNRIYAHHWSDRPHSATDNGALLAHVWSAQTDVGTCYSVPQIWQDTNRAMVVSGGRHGQVKAWDGSSGSELWSAALPQGTDADATIDPASGKVYLPAGSDSIWVAGLDKNGNPLWGTVSKPVFAWQNGVDDPQRAQSAGCLSHDGLTYYFQTVSPNGQGKLYAINTANGSLKWSFPTGSRGWERTMSSPIVSANGVIVVGNNEGGTYFALLDNGSSATQLDTLAVADSGEARNSATLSNDGLLYLSGRWPWTTGNGDNDVPTQQSAYLFTAFDLTAGVFGPVMPEITNHPVSQTVESGTTAILSVEVAGNPVPSLQWYIGTSGDTSQPIAGATAATFTTPALTATTIYWVRATNSEGGADSTSALVTVHYAPEIAVEEPAGTDVDSGATRHFGGSPVGVPTAPLAFTIRNTGDETLTNLGASVTGSHAADFAVNPHDLPISLAPGGEIVLTITFTPGAAGSRVATLSITRNGADQNPFLVQLGGTGVITLADAVDALDLQFTTGGDAPWSGQTEATFDGIDAAASGNIDDGQESWMETSVAGPGELSFWWNASSEMHFDILEFYIDGVLQNGPTSGEMGWTRRLFILTPGSHTLRWRYVKDDIFSEGEDTGWVDGLEFFPYLPPQITSHPTSQSVPSTSSAILTVAATAYPSPTFQWFSGLSGDTSNPIAGATSNTYTTPGLIAAGSYWVRASNAAGTADSSTALIEATPVPEAQVDVAAKLAGGLATVSTSTLDIGSSANIFDGSSSTLARTAAVNPMVVTLQFQQPLQLARSRVFCGTGEHYWRIEAADTLADLDGATGSFRVALDWQPDSGNEWTDRLIQPGPLCRVVRLKLRRAWGDNYVHLYEWQLFSGTATPPVITTQPQSVALLPGQSLAPEMLRVIATGSEPLTYRWAKYSIDYFKTHRDGSPLFPEIPQLELGIIDPGDEGIYQVEIANSLSQVQSKEVVVGVNAVAQSHQDPEAADLWLQIELAPAGIAGGWRFEGERRWRVSGEPVAGLTAGQRTVVFKPVASFVRPPDEVLEIDSSSPGVLSRTYLPGDPAADSGSLIFHIQPTSLADPLLPLAERAQWRIAGEDDSHWSDSGTSRSGLPEGDYLIECKALDGRETPITVKVEVNHGETRESTAVYPPPFVNPTGTWNLLDFTTIHSATEPIPYACVGRVSSDQSEGSGFLVGPKVVLTDAGLVFDEGTLSFVTRPRWTAERHRDIHEPTGLEVKNILLMAGYTAQRVTEATPGQLTPASANLGVAAIRLTLPSPRFTGYLASDDVPHSWLGSAAPKRAVGYPSRLSNSSLCGRMHESAPSGLALVRIAGGSYATAGFDGGIGLSGAPLLVRHTDGRDYPAAIFIGGGAVPTARAIDSEVLRLAILAAEAPPEETGALSGAGASVTGGSTITSWMLGSSQDPAALQVDLEGLPPGATGGWRIGTTGTPRPSGQLTGSLPSGTQRIYFSPVAGRVSPGGGYFDVDLVGGRKYLLKARYFQFELSPSSNSVTARESALFSISPDESVTSTEWFRDGVLIQGESSRMLELFPVTPAMAGTYMARVSFSGETYWTQPATLTVVPAAQTVQWLEPQATTLQALPIDLEATADSGLPVQFEVVSGPATLTGSRLTPSGPGTVVLLASQPGNADFMAAMPVSKTIEFIVTTLTAWRFIQFGTETNTGTAADDADPDADGQKNRAEFAAGTDPKNAADVFRVLSSAKVGNIFRVTVPTKPGRSYTLRRGPSPSGPWTDITGSGVIPDERVLTLEDPAPDGPKAFYQVMTSAQ